MEFERKRLVTKEKYEKMVTELLNVGSATEFIQINYYYDTTSFDMLKRNETVRIRLKDNGLNLEHKLHKAYINGTRVCEEKSKPIKELPKSVIIQQYEMFLIGCMTTLRTNFKINNYLVSLDKNYYLGIIDYEIELEFDGCLIDDISNVFDSLGIQPANSKGKYSRFIEKYLSIQKSGI